MNENLAYNLIAMARERPHGVALRAADGGVTYSELEAATALVAGIVRQRGVEPGDRVGVMLPNVPEFAIAYYGVLRAGGVVVPMNVMLKRREVAFYLSDSEAKLIIAWHECEEAAAAGAQEAGAGHLQVQPGTFDSLPPEATPLTKTSERAARDTAVILYTSGTTGKPKGAELTHANLAINADVTKQMLGVGAGDVILGALPLFHAFGQTCGLNVAVSSGATLALVARFDPGAVLETIESGGVTVFEGVPIEPGLRIPSGWLKHATGEVSDRP